MMKSQAAEAPTSAGFLSSDTPLRRFLSDYADDKGAVVAALVLLAVLLAAAFAPLLASQDPYDLAQISVLDGRLAPGQQGEDGSTFWLGTDSQGRDILGAILYGLRISLFVGLASGVIAVTVGVAVGLTAAFFGGRVDAVIMRIVDLQLSFPAILVALILLAVLGRGVDKIILALAIVQWAYYTRTVRASALIERRREYIEAAACLALSNRIIIFKHLLPNVLPPLVVVATVQVAHAIALEATLSFLGIGLPVTEPSLGLLIANGFVYMMSGAYWISIFPGVALLVSIAAISLVGDRLRDVLNPRLQR